MQMRVRCDLCLTTTTVEVGQSATEVLCPACSQPIHLAGERGAQTSIAAFVPTKDPRACPKCGAQVGVFGNCFECRAVTVSTTHPLGELPPADPGAGAGAGCLSAILAVAIVVIVDIICGISAADNDTPGDAVVRLAIGGNTLVVCALGGAQVALGFIGTPATIGARLWFVILNVPLALAVVVGLFGGIGGAWFAEPRDLEKAAIGLVPLLGVVPTIAVAAVFWLGRWVASAGNQRTT